MFHEKLDINLFNKVYYCNIVEVFTGVNSGVKSFENYLLMQKYISLNIIQ